MKNSGWNPVLRGLPGLALFTALAGCSVPPEKYAHADRLYFDGRPELLLEVYKEARTDRGPDALVGIMKMLSAALLLQDWKRAEDLALEASTRVNIYLAGEPGERDALSTFGREREKPFKGEPHERAMADFYLGVLRYRRGDYEGALSCFRSAIQKDRGTFLLPVPPEEARRGEANVRRYLYDSDFLTFEIFAARAWAHLGEIEEARERIARAQRIRPELSEFIAEAADIERTNLLVLIEAGTAPRKRAVGPRGAILAYERGREVDVQNVTFDGRPLRFAQLDDLYYQATTLGGRAVDELNMVKARRQEALKSLGFATALGGSLAMLYSRNRNVQLGGLAALLVGLGTMAFAEAAIDPRADTRAWTTLPGALWLAIGRADRPGGGHRLAVRAREKYTARDWSQSWEDVVVHEPDTLLPVRLLAGRRGGRWRDDGGGPAAAGGDAAARIEAPPGECGLARAAPATRGMTRLPIKEESNRPER